MNTRRVDAAAYLALPLAVLVLLFLAPLLFMARSSVMTREGSLTLAQFGRFFGDAYYASALAVTLGTALGAAALAIVIGYPIAYVYWRASRIARSIMLVALLAPFYVNIVAKVFGWMILLEPLGLGRGYAAVVIVSVHRCLPFVVLLLASALASIDDELLAVARVCGAPPARVLRTVILPLSIPGIVASAIVGFSLTVAGFVIPLLLGGTARGRFVPVLMYQSITVAQNWAFGAAMAVVLLIASLVTIAAGNAIIRSTNAGRTLRADFAQ
jgi:ABC-type spermidine/putrescine transport system permease subunit I